MKKLILIFLLILFQIPVFSEEFRDGMNMDEMRFRVYLGYERYNEINISVGSSFIDYKKTFSLMIITNK